jgi:hypothetical protein
MNAMHRLVRRVTESLPVARGSVGSRICCYRRSIRVIWCGIEPRFAEFRADGDDSQSLQNDATASFTPAVYGCGCGLPLCQKLEGIEYDVREPMMSEIR